MSEGGGMGATCAPPALRHARAPEYGAPHPLNLSSAVIAAAGCLLDPSLSAALGRPEGTVLLWILGVIAAGAFFTAIHRTIWIARRLRRGP